MGTVNYVTDIYDSYSSRKMWIMEL